jgi:hypothetical protein
VPLLIATGINAHLHGHSGRVVARSTHWFNHVGSTFQYELTIYKTDKEITYVASVSRDGKHFAVVADKIARDPNAVVRWSDVATELIAVIHAEGKIRGLL